MADAESTGNAAFIKASVDVKSLTTKPSNDVLLELYALFKQGIVGDNNDPAPGMFDLKGKAKYNAWKAKAGMSKEEAQSKYIELVNSLIA
ncbi:Acyl-CoA-binding protein-like protein [Smittium culicis]|uniref:Acyl-CoA-binding protein-like protein n=1 Tax=Smittium culicis TaxID=133412 RepID=A0A1R1YCI8_9FUNG|nr:Acyl-CoA-binding protein-like protein [Smittium culicis]